MKRALVLENESIQKDDRINKLIEKFKNDGYEITIIEFASSKPRQEVLDAMTNTNVLLFQTTWLRTHELEPLGKLLTAIQAIEIYAISICSHSLQYNLENTFDVETLAKLSKHKLFDVTDVWGSRIGKENWCTEFNLKQYQEQIDKEAEERKRLYQGLKKTGFKIKIKKIQAFGGAWSNLKEGDIVEAIDYSEHDPNPKRGVWVMGNGEPVKLLNSDGYDEFEYADNSCFALARDFFARGNQANNHEMIKLMAEYINGTLQKEIGRGEKTLWDFCNELCEVVGVERRGNRSYFERRLTEYTNQYKYFCEKDRFSFR